LSGDNRTDARRAQGGRSARPWVALKS